MLCFMFRSQRLLYCQSQLHDWAQISNDVNPSVSTGWRKPCRSVWVKNVACNFYVFKAYLNFLLLLGGFLWWCFHNYTDPWGKLPSDKPFYMILNSVFSCSLFHEAVKSILTNKQLREQNQSKYITLSYCSLNSVSSSWPFTHSKDCVSSVKPICCLAVCTPIWAMWWREFKSSTLPEHFIMGSWGARFPPATNC